MSQQLPKKLRVLACQAALLSMLTVSASTAMAEEVTASTPSDATANDTTDTPDVVISDPYETFNRHTFAFNDALDTNILQPVARVYNKIIPKPLNMGIHNFFLNLNTVSTIVDDFLQFNFYQMTNDLWRLTINTTLGIGGLFDVATRMNLEYYQNDFGMVLATWGFRESNYLVLPFYGSYTVRDGLSLPVDYFVFSAYRYIEPTALEFGLYGLSVIEWRASTLKYNDLMDAAALDKYVFVRNAYLQRRAYQIEENRHLGLFDRNNRLTADEIKDEAPNAPGADANIDESTNLGTPANSTLQGPGPVSSNTTDTVGQSAKTEPSHA